MLKTGKIFRLRIIYEKKGPSGFISGKNFAKVIERCLRRIEIPLKFTEGFSPHPKISFGYTLPVNIQGENECLDIYLTEKINIEEFLKRINRVLPEGTVFKKAFWIDPSSPSLNELPLRGIYKVEDSEGLDLEYLKKFGKVKKSEDCVEILINMRNFKHREFIEYLKGRKILREILWSNRYGEVKNFNIG